MRKLSAFLLFLSLALTARSQVSGTIKDITRDYPSPTPSEMLGKWSFSGMGMVFMEDKGPLPPEKEVATLMDAMGVNPQSLSVTFHDLKKCTFAVGKKSFNINWAVKAASREFRVSLGPMGLTGYLVDTGDGIEMVFNRRDLFIMLYFLCTGQERKNIKPLGELLDRTQGLTLGILFTQ